jgi:hypothetical protein
MRIPIGPDYMKLLVRHKAGVNKGVMLGPGWHQTLTVNQNDLGASDELLKMLLRVDRDYFCRHCESSVAGEVGSVSRVSRVLIEEGDKSVEIKLL